MGRLERKYLAHYLEIPGDPNSVYVRLGKDLESYEEELNPKVSVQRNLAGEPSVTISGYEADGKVEQYYADPNEALFYYVQNIANKRLTDDTCKTHKVDALFDSAGVQIWAYREDCYVVPRSIGGDTSGVQIPFDIYCAGNRIYGTFDPETKTFEGGGEEPPSGGGVVPLHVLRNGVYSGEGISYNPVVVDVDADIPIDVYTEKRYIERRIGSNVSNSEASSIGLYAFADMASLVNVSLPKCSSMSSYAFRGCTSLTTVYMPSVSGRLGDYAFENCYSLSNIVLNSSAITFIGYQVFNNCRALTSVSFPSCSYLADWAFQSCTQLSSAVFKSCSTIGYGVFSGCTSLSYVSFPVCSRIGSYAFSGCAMLTSASFPSATTVEAMAFAYCSQLSSLSLPVCERVGGSAFSGTSISSLYMPALMRADYSAFRGMSKLTEANLPALTSVPSYAFLWNSEAFHTVRLQACSRISAYAFSSCSKLMSVYLQSTAVAGLVASNAFMGTPMFDSTLTGSFGSIYVPSSLVASYKAATNWNTLSERITSIV